METIELHRLHEALLGRKVRRRRSLLINKTSLSLGQKQRKVSHVNISSKVYVRVSNVCNSTMSISSSPIKWTLPCPWKVKHLDLRLPSLFFVFEEIVRAFTQVINDNLCFYWGTSRWSPMEIMVRDCSLKISAYVFFRSKEAYSVARQFNLIPPTGEQSEYNFFQREKVEVLLPDVFHKIGQLSIRDERERDIPSFI